MTTLDFEREISPGVAGSYPVVARAPGGEVATTLRWPLTPAELDHQFAVIKDKVLASSAPAGDCQRRQDRADLGAERR